MAVKNASPSLLSFNALSKTMMCFCSSQLIPNPLLESKDNQCTFLSWQQQTALFRHSMCLLLQRLGADCLSYRGPLQPMTYDNLRQLSTVLLFYIIIQQ